MKHAVRDAGAFIGSQLGAFIIAGILWTMFRAPSGPAEFFRQECPPIPMTAALCEYVRSTNMYDFFAVIGLCGTVLGVVLALISEYLLPGPSD